MPVTLTPPAKPEASMPQPTLTLHELGISGDAGRQLLAMSFIVKPAWKSWEDAYYRIRRDGPAALAAAKAEFLAGHATVADWRKLQAAAADARSRQHRAEHDEQHARAAAGMALENLNLEEHARLFKAAESAKQEAAILAQQADMVEQFAEAARGKARSALGAALHAEARDLEAEARQEWNDAAGAVLAAVPWELVQRLWHAEAVLRHWTENRWMPALSQGEEGKRLLDLPGDGVKSA
jgi:hypothetical protein